MSELKTCIVDLRGEEGWTRDQRRRKAALGLVSPTWSMNPLGYVPKVGVHLAPGYLEYDGETTVPIYQAIKRIADEHPFPDGKPFVLWTDGRAVLYGLNLASPGCAEAFVRVIVDWAYWAHGICLDYFTTTGWLLAQREGMPLPLWASPAYYADFDAGLRMVCAAIRQMRPQWFITGYQYHETPATSALDGPFMEDRYTRNFQLSAIESYVESIKAQRNALASFAILEQRELASYSGVQSLLIRDFCETHGYYLSRGRDATALGDLTPA